MVLFLFYGGLRVVVWWFHDFGCGFMVGFYSGFMVVS